MTTATTKYIALVDVTPDRRKTAIVDVFNRRSGDRLGQIRWFARWRQYCFFPESGTVFNTDCMAYISGHIMGLMAQRAEASSRRTGPDGACLSLPDGSCAAEKCSLHDPAISEE